MDTSSEQLFSHLLGDIAEGPGLLRRVGAKVADLTREDGRPGFVTSSVMGAGSHRRHSDPSEDAARVMDLAVGLIQWRSPDVNLAPEVVRGSLIRYLRQNRMSDVEYLLGSKKRKHRGYLFQVGDEVRGMLTAQVPKHDRCEQLEDFLREWLATGCDHDFVPQQVDGTRTTTWLCNCGAGYWTDRRDPDRWLAVV